MPVDDEFDSQHDQGTTPDKVERKFTDCACGILFILSIGAMVGVYIYAIQHGNVSMLKGVPAASGDLCVDEKPYLYFCQDESGMPSYSKSVCVSDCAENGCGGKELQYTARTLGSICLPDFQGNSTKLSQADSEVEGTSEVAWFMKMKSIYHAWKLLLGAGIGAFVGGFLLLFIMRCVTGCVVYTVLSLFLVSTAGLGGLFVFQSYQPNDVLPTSGNADQDLQVGVTILIVDAIVLLFVLCKRKSIANAIDCVTSAAECIAESPLMLLEPLVSAIFRIALLVVLVVGWVYLLACADGWSVKMESGYPSLQVDYDDVEKVMLGFLLLMSFWLLEFGHALSTFVIIYMAQMWCFKQNGGCDYLRGYKTGLTYHFGSLAMGSFFIAVVRVIRAILGTIQEASKDSGNKVAEALACIFNCIVSCFERFLQKLNKFAYMDVCINSNNFCVAAGHALSILSHNATDALALQGAAFIFEVLGVVVVTVGGYFGVYFAATNIDMYTNMESATYVSDPSAVAVVAALICCAVSMPFVLVFSTVADTALFCGALDTLRKPLEEEQKSFIDRHFAVCCGSPSSKKARTKVDNSHHPPGTQKLLDKLQK